MTTPKKKPRTAKPKHTTREGWLQEAIVLLKPVFKKVGNTIPSKVMVGCGWPRGGKRETIGQCFGKAWTSDDTTHIYICPTQGDPIEVLAILVHELVHAAVGVNHGHRKEFSKLARAIGLEGKLTATTVSEKSPLHATLKDIAKRLGKYPHSKMVRKSKPNTDNPHKWIRLRSPNNEAYKVVISPKSLAEQGPPNDPDGEAMVPCSKHERAKFAAFISHFQAAISTKGKTIVGNA